MIIERVKDEEFFEFARYVGMLPNTKRGVIRCKGKGKDTGYVFIYCERDQRMASLENAVAGLLGYAGGTYSNKTTVLGFTDSQCKDADENGLNYSEQWLDFIERKNIASRPPRKIEEINNSNIK